MTSARPPLVLLALSFAAVLLASVHAGLRARLRAGDQGAIDAVARRMPSADLAFAGSVRHLRFPSLSGPEAAFADAPASPDLDPGGGAIAPPRALYLETAWPANAEGSP